MKRITAKEFEHAVENDPAWASKLTEPVKITDYCHLYMSDISHLSPLLTFVGRDESGEVASFFDCPSLEVAEGCFDGHVDFSGSGITLIGDHLISKGPTTAAMPPDSFAAKRSGLPMDVSPALSISTDRGSGITWCEDHKAQDAIDQNFTDMISEA